MCRRRQRTTPSGQGEPAAAAGEVHWGGIAGTHWWLAPQAGLAAVLMTQRQMEFWPGVHALEASRVSNVYLVVGTPATLVDTGPPGALPRLLREMRRAGVQP